MEKKRNIELLNNREATTMQMNRIEHDLWVRAVNELCRACPFTACPGQTKCVRLAERIVEMKEELR